MELKDLIRTIPDYPHAGILFRDITTLLQDARGFRQAVDQLVQPFAGTKIDKVVGIEARGFILGGAVSHQLSVGFVPVRKKGKLPWKAMTQEYALEYDTDVRAGLDRRRPDRHRRHGRSRDQADRAGRWCGDRHLVRHRPAGLGRPSADRGDGQVRPYPNGIRRRLTGSVSRLAYSGDLAARPLRTIRMAKPIATAAIDAAATMPIHDRIVARSDAAAMIWWTCSASIADT